MIIYIDFIPMLLSSYVIYNSHNIIMQYREAKFRITSIVHRLQKVLHYNDQS